MNKNELISKLVALDEEVSMVLPNDERINMTIVGGGALILQGYLNRITLDIDLIDIYYPILMPILEKYDVNCRSNTFVDCLAENYTSRLVKVNLSTKIIDYFTLSLEDLVIMKLFSTRGKDHQDIREKGIIEKLNWGLLDSIISSGEVDVSFNERRYKEFLSRYHEYVEECKKWEE